jgi:hypothetical protein
MALFQTEELNASAPNKVKAESILLKGFPSYWDSRQKSMEDQFRDYSFIPENYVIWNSFGEWSMHELLYYMLVRSGPANVYITTWAISELAMRSLCKYMKEGLIRQLHLFCDYRNTSRKPAELAYIEQNATNIKLGKCHAKLTVIDSEILPVYVSGSANYTKNPRFESGSIYFNRELMDFQRNTIIDLMTDGKNYR